MGQDVFGAGILRIDLDALQDLQVAAAVLAGNDEGTAAGLAFVLDHAAHADRAVQFAAEQGDAPSSYNLAHCLRNGIGTERDEEQARLWYERAIDAGSDRAAFYLAEMNEKGQGGEMDLKKAVQFYEKAYTLGSKEAARRLGELYQKGRGVIRSKKTAREWQEKAGEP